MLLAYFHSFICTLSICSNVLLLYLILFNTPKHPNSYAVMLTTLCIYELTTSTSSLIVFSRIVPLGSEGIVCVYSGPCVALDSDHICFLIYALVLHGFTMYNIQMTANFCFQYYVLKRSDPGVRQVVLANFLLLSPAIISACCFLFSLSPELEVRQLIQRDTPQYDFSQNRLIGIAGLTNSWAALPSIFLIVLTALPCILVNILVGTAVSTFLRKRTRPRSVQKHAQRTIPSSRFSHFKQRFRFFLIAFLIAVACYVVGQLNIVRSPLQEYGTHMIGDCCVVSSPLLTMFYVRPYRKRIEQIFGTTRSDRVVSISIHTDKPATVVTENSSTIKVVERNHY